MRRVAAQARSLIALSLDIRLPAEHLGFSRGGSMIPPAAVGCKPLLASSARCSDRTKPFLDDLNVFDQIRLHAQLELFQLVGQ